MTHPQINPTHALYMPGPQTPQPARTNPVEIVRFYYDPNQARASDGKWTLGSGATHHAKQADAAAAAKVKHDAHRHALASSASLAAIAAKSGGDVQPHLDAMRDRVRKMQRQAYAARDSALKGNMSVSDADERMAAYHHFRLLNRAMKTAHRLKNQGSMEELAKLASDATRPGAIQVKEGTAQAKALAMEKAGHHYQTAKALKAHLRANPDDKDAAHAWAAHASLYAHHKAQAKGTEDPQALALAKTYAGKISAQPGAGLDQHVASLHAAGVMPEAAAPAPAKKKGKIDWYEKAIKRGKTATPEELHAMHDRVRDALHKAVGDPDHKVHTAAKHLWAAHTNARTALAALWTAHSVDGGKLNPSGAKMVQSYHKVLGEQISDLKGMKGKQMTPAIKAHIRLLEQTHKRISEMYDDAVNTTPSTGQAPGKSKGKSEPTHADLAAGHEAMADKARGFAGEEQVGTDKHKGMKAAAELHGHLAKARAALHSGDLKGAAQHAWNAAQMAHTVPQSGAAARRAMLKAGHAGLAAVVNHLKGDPIFDHMAAVKASNDRSDAARAAHNGGNAGLGIGPEAEAHIALSHAHHNVMHAHNFMREGNVVKAEQALEQSRKYLDSAHAKAQGLMEQGKTISPEHAASLKLADQGHQQAKSLIESAPKSYEKAVTPSMSHAEMAQLHADVAAKYPPSMAQGGAGHIHQILKSVHEHLAAMNDPAHPEHGYVGNPPEDHPSSVASSLAMARSGMARARKMIEAGKASGLGGTHPTALAQAEASLKVAQQTHAKHLADAHAETHDLIAQHAAGLADVAGDGGKVVSQQHIEELASLRHGDKLSHMGGVDDVHDSLSKMRQAASALHLSRTNLKPGGSPIYAAQHHETARQQLADAAKVNAATHAPVQHELLNRAANQQGGFVAEAADTHAAQHGAETARAYARATYADPHGVAGPAGSRSVRTALAAITEGYEAARTQPKSSKALRKSIETAARALTEAKAKGGDSAEAGGMNIAQATEHLQRLMDHRSGTVDLKAALNAPAKPTKASAKKADAAAVAPVPTDPAHLTAAFKANKKAGFAPTTTATGGAYLGKGKVTPGAGEVTGTAQGHHIAHFLIPQSKSAPSAEGLASIHHAANLIASVHGVPADLHAASINPGGSGASGASGAYSADGSDQLHDTIGIAPGAAHRTMVLVHEMGHWLDRRAFSVKKPDGKNGSGFPGGHPDMLHLRDTIMNSAAVKRLHALQGKSTVMTTTASGKMVKAPVSGAHAAYLGRRSEIFARAYAQYIAHKTGDAEMKAGIDHYRADPVYGDQKWSDEEFKPIAAAFDQMFRNKGLMK